VSRTGGVTCHSMGGGGPSAGGARGQYSLGRSSVDPAAPPDAAPPAAPSVASGSDVVPPTPDGGSGGPQPPAASSPTPTNARRDRHLTTALALPFARDLRGRTRRRSAE
jgi:hypothetical protein